MRPPIQYLCALLISLAAPAVHAATDIQFNRDIRPILSKNCFGCHGPSEDAKAGLHLDTFESATNSDHPKRKGHAAIVPGTPEKSLAIQLIESTDPSEIMPPPESHKQLSAEEKALLREWIRQGAQYEAHWSLIPLKSTTPDIPADKHPVELGSR